MTTKAGTLKWEGKHPKQIIDVHKYDCYKIVPDSGQDLAGFIFIDKDTTLTVVSENATITINDSP